MGAAEVIADWLRTHRNDVPAPAPAEALTLLAGRGAPAELIALYAAVGADVPGLLPPAVPGRATTLVRPIDLHWNGQDRWTFDGGAPFFAAPAIAGQNVYVANLKGVVHALNLANGQAEWQLDLATHPDVRSPGQVYGSPIVTGGRLVVATCNVAGAGQHKATVVVCIGPKS